MLESTVEKYLVNQLRVLGLQDVECRCVVKKMGGPGWRGWPDRMVLFRSLTAAPGITHWVELKRPKGGKFEPLQLRNHAVLRRMGFVVRVINSKLQVDAYIEELFTKSPCLVEA